MARKELGSKLYYSITEVAEHLDVAPSLLRYWEKEFPELVLKRNSKGTRFYTQENIEYLEMIHDLVKVEGFTLQGARNQLKRSRKRLKNKKKTIEKLVEIKSFLAALRENS